jgi:hypothetical protein
MTKLTLSEIEYRRLGRTRSRWRRDREVVDFLTDAYGLMTVMGCAAAARDRFGVRAPRKSAIHRFWQWLDRHVIDDRAA